MNSVPADDFLIIMAESYFINAFEHYRELTAKDTLKNLSMCIQCVPFQSKLALQAIANRADVLSSLKEYQVTSSFFLHFVRSLS